MKIHQKGAVFTKNESESKKRRLIAVLYHKTQQRRLTYRENAG